MVKHAPPEIGTRFGRWEVISPTTRPGGSTGPRLTECRCECGLIRLVNTYSLLTGVSQSCRKCIRLRKGRADVERRFWAKVKKTKTCWNWTGATAAHGYGNFWNGTRNTYAHVFSLELATGKPISLQVNHTCIGNKRCVRPEHLYEGTQKQNIADMLTQGRGRWQKGAT